MGKKIRIISRQSRLALLQVEELVKEAGITDYELIKTTSYGDRHKEVSLMDEGLAQDFFTRELDEALLEGRADIAVHSAKDLPNPLPDGIELLALTEGKDPSDSLVARDGLTLATLPAGSKVGTSSAQRKEELLKVRPDLVVVPIRGTIEERIAQVDDGSVDALIVATCALDRLGLSHRATERLPFKTHPLQGKLAVTGRHYGKVWLVGYGPGDPELITVKGQRLLKEADVVFYDDLSFVPVPVPVKKYIYVGKRSGRHSHSQEE
ncbi:MAG: hydroxymethylbilane synthase, partial [Prevotella sp.]|nr:hydroxymethylbilane synthase [Prevotella sp.]